jgi:PAS domain-containing protein
MTDPRPQVLGAYEDLDVAMRATNELALIAREAGDSLEIQFSMWRFDSFNSPTSRESPARHAQEADIIVVAPESSSSGGLFARAQRGWNNGQAAASPLRAMQITPTPSHRLRSEEHLATACYLSAGSGYSMGHNQGSRSNASADSQTGAAAQNAPERADARPNGSMHYAGKFKIGHAAGFLHPDASDLPPEWKSVRLDSQVSQLLESMKDPVVAHDYGVIIGFNQRVPELLDCPAEKILWRRLSKFIDPVSLPTLTRWIQASDHYAILVNGVRGGKDSLLLRLEGVASLAYPGGRRVEIVSLAEFAAAGRSAASG